MTLDGFLGFLGLVVAIYALLSIVNKYRLRLHGLWLWIPSLATVAGVIYLLLFDLIGVPCNANWCAPFLLATENGLTANKLAFVVVLVWLAYIAGLSRLRYVRTRQLPLLSSLVDRLVSEKRFPELVDFLEPHTSLISRCASRQLPLQRLSDRLRWHGNPFFALSPPEADEPTKWEWAKQTVSDRCIRALKPLLAWLPEKSKREEAALGILRVLHTNERLVEFIALERPMFALQLMDARTYDYDFSDRAFDLMMAHPESQLRRETLLNQNVGLCFHEIDPKNPLIHALFADAEVANRLQVWRPVGNYPLRLLERNIGNYRQTISAKKPWEDQLLHQDPTYVMISFFDIMVRSAMRDEIKWHMWLFYFDIVVKQLLKSMDRAHPDYDRDAEFPNLGYYLIYEVFDAYGDWLRVVECCPENSPAVTIESTAPDHENGSIFKSTILSIGNSLKHLLESETDDGVITYLMGMLMRDYRDLAHRKNGGARAQEALRNSILAGGYYGLKPIYLARLGDCYAEIDPLLQFETEDFGDALKAALR